MDNPAYILGNGPSLTVELLDSLIGHVTYACNRIHLIYDKTEWRPTYYVRTEPPAGGDIWDAEDFFDECRLHVGLGEKCFFPKSWVQILGEHENVEYENTCHHFKYGVDRYAPRLWHLPMVCDYGTVLTAAMQVAVKKGHTSLHVFGADLTGGHFDDAYGGQIQTELWAHAHKIAKRSCPIPIFYGEKHA